MNAALLGSIAACVTVGIVVLKAHFNNNPPGGMALVLPAVLVGLATIMISVAVKIIVRT